MFFALFKDILVFCLLNFYISDCIAYFMSNQLEFPSYCASFFHFNCFILLKNFLLSEFNNLMFIFLFYLLKLYYMLSFDF